MTDPDKEMARETYDRVRHGLPNHEIGIQIIEQVIRSVRQAENEACAKEAEKYVMRFVIGGVECVGTLDSNGEIPQVPIQIATAIRNRLNEKL